MIYVWLVNKLLQEYTTQRADYSFLLYAVVLFSWIFLEYATKYETIVIIAIKDRAITNF